MLRAKEELREGQKEPSSVSRALGHRLADQFESIGEDQQLASSVRCGPPATAFPPLVLLLPTYEIIAR